MTSIGSIEITVFHNNHIEPTVATIENIKKKMGDIAGCQFSPVIAVEQGLDPIHNKIVSINSLVLNTVPLSYQVCCMNEWISVRLNVEKDDHNVDIDAFGKLAVKMLTQLMEDASIYSNRLALNVNILSEALTSEFRDTSIGKKMYQTLNFYKDAPIEEWSSRVNSRVKIQMKKEETLNVINDISIVNEKGTRNKRILCHLDINTAQENTAFRFSSGDLQPFSTEVLKIVEQIRNDFEGSLNESC